MTPNDRRVLLIEPPFLRLFKETYSLDKHPLSLGYLGGTIKRDTDWQVVTWNADFSQRSETTQVSYLAGAGFQSYLANLRDPSARIWAEVRSTIAEFQPTVVGITTKSQNFASARLVARIAKEVNPEMVVVVGGPHPTMVGPAALDCPDIDVGVRGEGERTIVELLGALDGRLKIEDVTGIVYRAGDRVVEQPPRELIEDLDSLCFPHEAAPEMLKDYALYPARALSNIFATRGCPYNCLFCGSRTIWGRKVRFRSVSNVVREIRCLWDRGIRSVNFEDDTFGVRKEYIRELCNALMVECPGLGWTCELHVNLVDEEILSMMKRAGCEAIAVGVESGNDETLARIRKGFTIEKAMEAVDSIGKRGIEPRTFFMIGFPWETEAMLNDTIAAMRKIGSRSIIYSIFTPYPGSEAFELCKDMGLIGDDYDSSLYNHQSPANCFCANIPAERFRAIASATERMVDRRNSINRVRRTLSGAGWRRVRELGLGGSLSRTRTILESLLGRQ